MRLLERVQDKESCNEIYHFILNQQIDEANVKVEKLTDKSDQVSMKTVLIDYYVNLVDFQKGYELAKKLLPEVIDKNIQIEGIVRFQLNYSLVWVGELQELQISLTDFKNRLVSITNIKELFQWNCYISFIEGVHNYRIGNYELSETLLKQSLKQALDIGKRIHVAYRHLFLGILYIEIGDIDLAVENLSICRLLAREINNVGIEYWSIFWTAVGDLKVDRFSEATKKFNECQTFISKKKYYSNWIQAYLKHSLAKLYYLQDDYKNAKENFYESLILREQNSDFMGISQCLFDLIVIELDEKNPAKASEYLLKLEVDVESYNNSLIYCRQQIAKALIQKNKNRLYDKALAYKILKEILDHQNLNEELKIIAVLEICDVLIIEYQATNNEAPLEEIHFLLRELNESLETKRTKYSLQIETLLFRSQIFLLQGNVNEANRLIIDAKNLVEKNNLLHTKFYPKIEKKQQNLLDQVRRWKQLAEENIDIRTELNELQLSNYIKDLRAISKEYGFKFTGN